MAQFGAFLILLATALMWASKGRRWRLTRRKLDDWIQPDKLDWLMARVQAANETGRYTRNAAVACLVLVGVLDIILLLLHEPTVTQYIQGLVPNLWARAGLMVFAVAHTWAVFGLRGALTVALGCIYGHLFW